MAKIWTAKGTPLNTLSLCEGLVECAYDAGEGFKKYRDKVFQKPYNLHKDTGSEFCFPMVIHYNRVQEETKGLTLRGLAVTLYYSLKDGTITLHTEHAHAEDVKNCYLELEDLYNELLSDDRAPVLPRHHQHMQRYMRYPPMTNHSKYITMARSAGWVPVSEYSDVERQALKLTTESAIAVMHGLPRLRRLFVNHMREIFGVKIAYPEKQDGSPETDDDGDDDWNKYVMQKDQHGPPPPPPPGAAGVWMMAPAVFGQSQTEQVLTEDAPPSVLQMHSSEGSPGYPSTYVPPLPRRRVKKEPKEEVFPSVDADADAKSEISSIQSGGTRNHQSVRDKKRQGEKKRNWE